MAAPAALAGNPASGERKGLGEGVGEETEEAKGWATRPDADPVEGPRPQGRPGSSDSPASPGIPAEKRGPGSPAPALVPEAGVKGGTWGCQDRVGDSPSEALGGVGGVLSAGRSAQQMETRPQKLAQPQRLQAPGKTPLLTERCPNHRERRVKK